jgi:hypothetical protein
MKTRSVLLKCQLAAALIAGAMLSLSAGADELTAFALAREGNRYVGEQAKDKIVQIRSEKSVGSVTPNIWYVVYYEPTAALKATEVKFAAGKMVSVTRPLRLLEPVSGGDQPLDRSKLKVDSDQAIKTAMAEPILQNLKITATQLKLEKLGNGILDRSGPEVPVWKVKLWAAKLKEQYHDVDIGEVWLLAEDGKVVKSDLHIDRVD